MDERELDALLATIQEVEDLGFEKSLQQEMIDARGLAEHLKRLMQLKLVILNMDKNTMTEIRRYDRPLPVLHQVLTAAFLLLGEDEETTSVSGFKSQDSKHFIVHLKHHIKTH